MIQKLKCKFGILLDKISSKLLRKIIIKTVMELLQFLVLTQPNPFNLLVNFCTFQGQWIQDLTQAAPEATQVMLVGNKMDLNDQRQVSKQQAQKFAQQNNIPYMECSAKSGQSIEEAFFMLGKMMINPSQKGESTTEDARSTSVHLVVPPRKTLQQRCCS